MQVEILAPWKSLIILTHCNVGNVWAENIAQTVQQILVLHFIIDPVIRPRDENWDEGAENVRCTSRFVPLVDIFKMSNPPVFNPWSIIARMTVRFVRAMLCPWRANLISFKCKSASLGYSSCKEGVVRCRQEIAIAISKAASGGFMQTVFFSAMRDVTSALYTLVSMDVSIGSYGMIAHRGMILSNLPVGCQLSEYLSLVYFFLCPFI